MRAAATKIVAQGLANLGFARLWPRIEEGLGRHHHASRAVAALGCLRVDEGLLDRVRSLGRAEPFQRHDIASGGEPDRIGTAAPRRAVEQHRAGAAFSKATPVSRAVEGEIVTQEEEQRGVGLPLDQMLRAVNAQGEASRAAHHANPHIRAMSTLAAPEPIFIIRMRTRYQ